MGLRKYVAGIINAVLTSKIITPDAQVLPSGYNPIESIRGALLHWVSVPFNGQMIWCQLRCPTATQIEQCGDITNILVDKEDEKKEYSHDEIIQIRNYQEELCKVVLNVPRFDEVLTLVGDYDFVISEKRNELKALNKKFEENMQDMSEVEKKTFRMQIQTLELQLGFILPDDTMAFLCKWAMGNDVSEIHKITKQNFLKAASLAKMHGKAPSDYLSGKFTDFNKKEIDSYAALALNDFLREQETFNAGKHKWLLGKKRR